MRFFCQRQCENKFRYTVPAGYCNIFIMAFNDRFYQIQTKTHSVFVQTAGAVGFVETVKDIRQVIRRNGLALVFYADISLVILFIEKDGKRSVFVRKLNGIVHQIVDNLSNGIRIGMYKDVG